MRLFRNCVTSTLRVLAVLLVAGAIEPALAGVVIDSLLEDPRLGGDARMRMEIEGDLLRVDPPGAAGDPVQTSMIFDGKRDLMIVLDHKGKTAMEIDQSFMQEMMTRLAAAQKQLEAQLAHMPPEQQQMMRQMMAQRGAGAFLGGPTPKPEPGLSLKPTGQTRTIEGRDCTVSRLERGDKPVGEACIASFSMLGITRSDLAALSEMAAFQKRLAEKFRSPGVPNVSGDLELFRNLTGLPLEVVRRDGKTESRTRIVKIEKMDVPPARFEVPAGYSKRDMATP